MAASAGVSVAAPYKHFADREALLASLAVAGYREQRARFGGVRRVAHQHEAAAEQVERGAPVGQPDVGRAAARAGGGHIVHRVVELGLVRGRVLGLADKV